MKNFLIGLIIILIGLSVKSQQIQSFHYWFDAESVNSVRSAAYSGSGDLDIPTDLLGLGSHSMFYYFTSSDGGRSGVNVSSFFKTTVLAGSTGAEYWFDDDRGNKKNILISNLSEFENTQNINTDDLSLGEHVLSIRFLNSGGLWSSITKTTFTKTSVSGGISGMEYWFDDDFGSKKSVVGSLGAFSEKLIDATGLKIGYHIISYRFIKDGGVWSNIGTDVFLKKSNSLKSDNFTRSIRYWFDDNSSKISEKYFVVPGSTDFEIENIDCEDLALGNHKINYQFKDASGVWSSITEDNFSKSDMLIKEFKYPKIFLDKSSFSIGETIQIRGVDFGIQNYSKVIIRNNYGQDILVVNDIVTDNKGAFTTQITLPNNINSGSYYISAIDFGSSVSSREEKCIIHGINSSSITITRPALGDKAKLNKSFQINWKANNEGIIGFPIGQSAVFNKIFKLEYSSDFGASWNLIGQFVKGNSVFDYTQGFSEYFVPQSPGEYVFKVTEVSNPVVFSISDVLKVEDEANNGFIVNSAWDYSAPLPSNPTVFPVGLAADSVSRIILKLVKKPSNNQIVESVSASIEPIGYSAEGTRLLGRISKANTITSYSIEADNPGKPAYAYSTSTEVNPILDNPEIINFWLCAPVDYALSANDFSGARKIRVRFLVKYKDVAAPIEVLSNEIEIIRPPVLFVHGLNGSYESFINTKFEMPDKSLKNFSALNNFIWKSKTFASLDPGGSYDKNAKILLGQYINQEGEFYYNSFQSILRGLREDGYAANRFDYIGHSMGGDVARTAIALPGYNPAENSLFKFKNYGRGFINKLITVNTPHNGSPIADFIDDFIADLNEISITDFVGNEAKYKILYKTLATTADALSDGKLFNNVGGFLVKNNTNGFTKYIPSNAIKNLQSNSGGVWLNETYVKNHLIAGSLFDFADLTEENNPDFFKSVVYDEFIGLFKKILDWAQGSSLFVNDDTFNNNLKDIQSIRGKVKMLNYILAGYLVFDFVTKSDGVVSENSQLAGGAIEDAINYTSNSSGVASRSIGYGFKSFHKNTTDWLSTGNRIFYLLNAGLESPNFSSIIPGNPKRLGNAFSIKERVKSMPKLYSFVERNSSQSNDAILIVKPIDSISLKVDSSFEIEIQLNDTTGLKNLFVAFQGQYYTSFSKVNRQTFSLKCKGIELGYNNVVVVANYDSAGVGIRKVDVKTVNIYDNAPIISLSVFPKTIFSNPEQIVSYLITGRNEFRNIGIQMANLDVYVADTNVVKYDSLLGQFTSKDTGSTYIVFNYFGIRDTSYFYISQSDLPNPVTSGCLAENYKFGIPHVNNASVQWQTDRGNGFVDLYDDSKFTGSKSDTISIHSPVENDVQFKFRCLSVLNGNTSISDTFSIKFLNNWTGVVSTEWENPLNWSCGKVPDMYTDVYIPGNIIKYPILYTDVIINSIKLDAGAVVMIGNGANLLLKSKK